MGIFFDDIVSIWNAFYVPQKAPTTCWKAGYEMMIRYKGGDPKLTDSLPNHAQMVQRGIMDSEFSDCAKHIGLGTVSHSWFQQFNNMVHAIRSWGPVWCSGFFLEGKKHIIVVKGVNIDDQEIEYNDPWRAFTGALPKSTWRPFSWFAKNVNPVAGSCQVWEKK